MVVKEKSRITKVSRISPLGGKAEWSDESGGQTDIDSPKALQLAWLKTKILWMTGTEGGVEVPSWPSMSNFCGISLHSGPKWWNHRPTDSQTDTTIHQTWKGDKNTNKASVFTVVVIAVWCHNTQQLCLACSKKDTAMDASLMDTQDIKCTRQDNKCVVW